MVAFCRPCVSLLYQLLQLTSRGLVYQVVLLGNDAHTCLAIERPVQEHSGTAGSFESKAGAACEIL